MQESSQQTNCSRRVVRLAFPLRAQPFLFSTLLCESPRPLPLTRKFKSAFPLELSLPGQSPALPFPSQLRQPPPFAFFFEPLFLFESFPFLIQRQAFPVFLHGQALALFLKSQAFALHIQLIPFC